MTTISDLPEDLLREIVCRVELRDMRAVRFTCKKWDTLSKSSIFLKMHMRNEAARESRMVMIMDSNVHLISAVVDDVEHPSAASKGKLSRLSLDDSDEQQVKIVKVIQCEGLLLCVLKDTFKLVVWNPYLGQRRWIEPPSYSYRDPYGWDRYMYALGYDHEKKTHKILRFMDNDPILEHFGVHLLCHEIYDFDSNLWRSLDVDTPRLYIYFHTTGVPLNGNTYWLANHRNPDNDGFTGLICFDFTRETFGPLLPLPFPSEDKYCDVNALLSCLKGEKLSLLLQCLRLDEVQIWVTDPNNMSWSNVFKVDTGLAVETGFSDSGFFVDEEKKVAMVFDKLSHTYHTLNIIGEAGFFKQVNVVPLIQRIGLSSDFHAHVCSYVPSLVQVQIHKPPSRAFKRVFKRNKRCKFEIRPFAKRKLNEVILDEEGEDDHEAKRTRLDHEGDGPYAKRKLNQVILDEEEDNH